MPRSDAYALGEDRGRARVWTFRTTAIWAADEAEARKMILTECYRDIPAEQADAVILSLRKTPTGRWSAMVKRTRIEQAES